MRAERKLCVGESVRGSSFHLGRNVLARQLEGKQPHHTELSCTAQRELHRPRNSSSVTHVSSACRAKSLAGVHRPHEPPPPARQFGLSRRYRQGMAGQLFCSEAWSPIGFRCTRPVRELQTQARRSLLLEARFACSPVLKIDHVLVTWERSRSWRSGAEDCRACTLRGTRPPYRKPGGEARTYRDVAATILDGPTRHARRSYRRAQPTVFRQTVGRASEVPRVRRVS